MTIAHTPNIGMRLDISYVLKSIIKALIVTEAILMHFIVEDVKSSQKH